MSNPMSARAARPRWPGGALPAHGRHLQVADRRGDLQVPARVVWGAADRFQRLPYGQRLAWDLRTELRRIEGGRHFVPEDHPERLAAVDEVLGAVGSG
jgi:pimeloyl-ACP methyl ester carboxylesterase